jgi:hypothetical protein
LEQPQLSVSGQGSEQLMQVVSRAKYSSVSRFPQLRDGGILRRSCQYHSQKPFRRVHHCHRKSYPFAQDALQLPASFCS